MNKLILAAVLAAAAAVPAAAQTPIRVAAFDSIELRGGGEVIVRHGPSQRVTMLSGDQSLAGFDVERGGRLVIRACRRSCRNHNLRVEIVTPDLDAVAITGGGSIRGEGRFPAARSLAVAVNGGGTIDARAFPAREVAAAVNGGGRIRTTPGRSLAASIQGGGTILYTGDPEKAVSIHGGGTVTRDR